MFLSYQMRLVIRKNLSSGFGTRVDAKLTCAVIEARLGLEIMAMETGGIKLPRQQTTKAQIRLCRCAG